MDHASASRLLVRTAVLAILAEHLFRAYWGISQGSQVFSLGVSLFLLYRLHRGGAVAWVAYQVIAGMGLVVFGLQIGTAPYAPWLALAYLVQILAVSDWPVRLLTRTGGPRQEQLTPAGLVAPAR